MLSGCILVDCKETGDPLLGDGVLLKELLREQLDALEEDADRLDEAGEDRPDEAGEDRPEAEEDLDEAEEDLDEADEDLDRLVDLECLEVQLLLDEDLLLWCLLWLLLELRDLSGVVVALI